MIQIKSQDEMVGKTVARIIGDDDDFLCIVFTDDTFVYYSLAGFGDAYIYMQNYPLELFEKERLDFEIND